MYTANRGHSREMYTTDYCLYSTLRGGELHTLIQQKPCKIHTPTSVHHHLHHHYQPTLEERERKEKEAEVSRKKEQKRAELAQR